MVANILLASAKLVAGMVGHSHALVADAVESLADLFSSVIVWRGIVVASAPADEDHPYGHGKAEPIAAAVVSSMLLVAAAAITIQAARESLRVRCPIQTALCDLEALPGFLDLMRQFTDERQRQQHARRGMTGPRRASLMPP